MCCGSACATADDLPMTAVGDSAPGDTLTVDGSVAADGAAPPDGATPPDATSDGDASKPDAAGADTSDFTSVDATGPDTSGDSAAADSADARDTASADTADTAAPDTAAGDASDAGRVPTSCRAHLQAVPAATSGPLTIDPDGAGGAAPFLVQCDMTTDGGGFTLVYLPSSLNHNTTSLDYTISSALLLAGASDALLAFRTSTGVVVGDTATFALPTQWRTQSPFKYPNSDLVVSAKVAGVTASTTLRFGNWDFAATCGDAWRTDPSSIVSWGRICLQGTTAPFYNGFASGTADGCPTSAESYLATQCTAERRFTIAVR